MKKPTKKQTIVAAKKSIKHWQQNVESYPVYGDDKEKGYWFNKNCLSDSCTLCELLKEQNRYGIPPICKWCPLGPTMCCSQWQTLKRHIESGTSTKRHAQAVLDKLINELEKLLPPLD